MAALKLRGTPPLESLIPKLTVRWMGSDRGVAARPDIGFTISEFQPRMQDTDHRLHRLLDRREI